jgi:polysaccharide export outer membrane protein
VPEYHLRVDDQLEFVYRFTHRETSEAYRLAVGDQIIIESLTDETLNRGDINLGRGLEIQPDGSITLPLLGQVSVARRSVDEVRQIVQSKYEDFYNDPAITVTPLQTNTRLEDLRATVDGRFGSGGQRQVSPVTPEGTIQLPGIGSAPAHGLNLNELKGEIEARYMLLVGPGVEVTPVLTQRAPRFVYVVGEVLTPGQFELQQPTTVMPAIALAGGWNNGGNLREIVVFRGTVSHLWER